mmetsp:Transcript_4375/g.7452  ORF Transcript_4375/g.7452 Transcript_4375/m.7452 type:complete len:99 (+) Transcript_4375:2921-3217(+)
MSIVISSYLSPKEYPKLNVFFCSCFKLTVPTSPKTSYMQQLSGSTRSLVPRINKQHLLTRRIENKFDTGGIFFAPGKSEIKVLNKVGSRATSSVLSQP